jgi:ribulose-phosphate 3-epimerase
MTLRRVQVSASILAADFARLGEQIREAEDAGVDRLHFDVMDGHFVPNLSLGPMVLESLRPITRLPIEVHLMVCEPLRFLEAFARAGADYLMVHAEIDTPWSAIPTAIRQLGKKVGLVLNPETPAESIIERLPDVDIVVVMTVHPGFSGQAFLPQMLPKLRTLRERIDRLGLPCDLEADGGVNEETARLVVQAGANVVAAASAIFRASDGIPLAVERLLRALSENVTYRSS